MSNKCLFAFFLSVLLWSCNNSNNKSLPHDKDSTMSVVKENSSIVVRSEKKSINRNKIYHFDVIKVDTVAGDFHVSYKVQDDDQVITTYPITDGKGRDTAYYANREVVINVGKGGKNILSERKIRKLDFSSYIPQKEISKYCISYFKVESINSNGVTFSISFCIPDTDVCYWFEGHITNNGQIKIKEVVDEESDM